MTVTIAALLAASVLGRPQQPPDVRSVIDVRHASSMATVTEPWTFREPRRPVVLPVLYGTYVTFQVLDVQTTRRAMAAGARESNPAVAPLSGDIPRLVAVKAITTAGTLYFADRLWRRHRVGAVVVMAALNGISAWAVVHNARITRQVRQQVRP